MATNTPTLLRDAEAPLGISDDTNQQKTTNMLCSRCLLPVLALYLLLEEMSAAVLPKRNRLRREVVRRDQEDFHRLLDHSVEGDLSVGDAGDVAGRPSHADTLSGLTEQLMVHRQSQYHYNRKASEKKRKVAPLDPIGSFQMASSRTRKDEPDVHRRDYSV